MTILDDEIVGASEFFIVSLFNAQPSTVVLIPDTITVTIRDNDDGKFSRTVTVSRHAIRISVLNHVYAVECIICGNFTI